MKIHNLNKLIDNIADIPTTKLPTKRQLSNKIVTKTIYYCCTYCACLPKFIVEQLSKIIAQLSGLTNP